MSWYWCSLLFWTGGGWMGGFGGMETNTNLSQSWSWSWGWAWQKWMSGVPRFDLVISPGIAPEHEPGWEFLQVTASVFSKCLFYFLFCVKWPVAKHPPLRFFHDFSSHYLTLCDISWFSIPLACPRTIKIIQHFIIDGKLAVGRNYLELWFIVVRSTFFIESKEIYD